MDHVDTASSTRPLWKALIEGVVGRWHWQPPAWVGQLAARFELLLLMLMLLAGAGGIAWWNAHRPMPVIPDALSVSVEAPVLTDYRQTPIVIAPLRLRFSESAAPLEHIGKLVTEGISLLPLVNGQWLWEDESTLLFTPAGDWPVGQRIAIELEAKKLLAAERRIMETRFEFATASFELSDFSGEFYQDPVDAALKKAAWTLSFTHPVDAASLEAALAVSMRDKAGRRLPDPTLQVRLDSTRLTAYVQTEGLSLPPNGGVAYLAMENSVRSAFGGPALESSSARSVDLPALYSAQLSNASINLVEDARFEPRQALLLSFNQAMQEQAVNAAVRVWLLPERHPDSTKRQVPYPWSSNEVDEALLAQSEVVTLAANPAPREFVEVHSYRVDVPPRRRLFVQVDKGLKSFGGFVLGREANLVISVPDYPQLLRFAGEGSLLSLRGEKRISVAARNHYGLRLEIGRIRNEQLHHLARNQNGQFSQPYLWSIGEDSLVERVEKRVRLDTSDPARTQYEGIDLGPYFQPGRLGIYLLSLRTFNAQDDALTAAETLRRNSGQQTDTRLVVLTDLGLLVKRNLDGTRDVFVQSLGSGAPVAGARVRAIAVNGETLAAGDTDGSGRASLPPLDDYRREKRLVMLTASLGEDVSFLPVGDSGRQLDFSRFDIGGDTNSLDPGSLRAHLFSDRGLYRPGDTIHIGMLVRATDWNTPLAGLPLELTVLDPRANLASRERVSPDAAGMLAFDFTPSESAASGAWTFDLALIGDDQRRIPIGNTTVQVREFAPDTMRVRATLSAPPGRGWIKPDALRATVAVENLFGTPAQGRRVEARMMLRPAFPSFAEWPGYQFYDPERAEEGFDEPFSDGQTDAEGRAEFELGLDRFERASYELSFLARAFEPASGRSVSAQATALVSNLDYMVGTRAADSLDYVQRGAKRELRVVAIGPDAAAKAVQGLRALWIERRFVSVLTQQESGLYRYESQERLVTLREEALDLGAEGRLYQLATEQPGEFRLEIRNADDSLLNRVSWSVAGAANVERSLDRNAELAVQLKQPDWRAGEEIELSIRAPYAGAGLITIEREKVYAQQWFKSDTTASVQRIRIPEGFEGSGYVVVQLLRDPASPEVYMSPLSYAVAPFSVDRQARTQPLRMQVPATVRPGERFHLDLETEGEASVLAFAVDEGILQVARYQLADPLDHFYRKKMLEVQSAQILDLVLPEFSRLMQASAPGGDGDSDLARQLNPFKRKTEKPATWWSGLTTVQGKHRFELSMPDHFNGSLRVMAVVASAQRIGIVQREMRVRGDYVLTPTVPTHVAPGDEFELGVGIANTREDGSSAEPVQLQAELPAGLSLVGGLPDALELAPGQEGSVRLRLRAESALGAVPIVLKAGQAGREARRRIEVSIRPLSVARQSLQSGRTDREQRISLKRDMYDERAVRQLAASISPLILIDGLHTYLEQYPYLCTEQLVSRALPNLIFRTRPELGRRMAPDDSAALYGLLRARQNSAGGLGLWTATPAADAYVSAHAALYLVEARERGQHVPQDLLDRLNRYLEQVARDPALSATHELRTRALALYLLLRQGRNLGQALAELRQQIERDAPGMLRGDVAGLLLAASYLQLKQEPAARQLIGAQLKRIDPPPAQTMNWQYAYYYDVAVDQALSVYLAFRHFPEDARRLSPRMLDRLVLPVERGTFNTLSAAYTALALEQYALRQPDGVLPVLLAVNAKQEVREIGQADGLIVRGSFAGGDRELRVRAKDSVTAWWMANEHGFDRTLPPAEQAMGLELSREILGEDGQPLTSMTLGQEATVRLRLRSLSGGYASSIAIVDLLPGGFEAILQTPVIDASADQDSDSASCNEDGDCGDESSCEDGEDCSEYAETDADSTVLPSLPSLALPGSSMQPEHVEVREDRVVIFTSVSREMSELSYRVRANNAGRFQVPPAYAESMYERGLHARGAPGSTLEVRQP